MNDIRTKLRLLDKQVVKCIFKPCKAISQDLGNLLQQDVVETSCTWSYAAPESNSLPKPPALAVAHALAGDKGPHVRLSPDPDDSSSVSAFGALHKQQMEAQQTMVVRFDPKLDKELVLVPVKVKTGQKSTVGGYWGYVVPANLLTLAARFMHNGRLAVVFDLDETLLMAHTVDSLQARIRRVNATKEAKAAELQSLSGEDSSMQQQRLQLSAEAQLLEAEGALLQQDFEMLDFYRRDPKCRVHCAAHSKIYEAMWERVRNSKGEEVTRPIVRIEIDGRPLIFTRINPDSKSTSVLLRPRPNWRVLKDYLSGMEDVRQGLPRKIRYEVFICTTAEKEYALEAWRLLDPEASIFPHDELANRRMLCVPHPAKKDLLNVLRWEQISLQMVQEPNKPPSILVTDESRALKGPGADTATMSLVVDDRADVWEEASRRCLMQVMPFHPHKEAGCDMLGPGAAPQPEYQASRESELELLRVTNTLRETRSKFYTELDHHIKPEAQRLMSIGVSEALQANPSELLPPMTLMTELLASSQFKPPAALGLTDREDRASDLRLLANDHTMMTVQQQQQSEMAAAAAGNGVGGVKVPAAAAAAAVPISDPRKRRAAALAGNTAASQPQQQQVQQQQQQFDFAGGIQGLLATLEGATRAPQQQQQPGQAGAAGQQDLQPATKKQKLTEQQQQQPAAAPVAMAIDPPAAAAAAPGLNVSMSGPNSTNGGLVTEPQVPPRSLVTPQYPLSSLQDPGLTHLPGPPVPPSQVVAVLHAAAAASRSPRDLAAYNEMFPAVLRAAAAPEQLLEVLACLAAQFRCNTDTAASVNAMRTTLGDDKFRVLQQVAGILDTDPEAAKFLKPIMDGNLAAAVQQQQPMLVDMRPETIDFRNISGPPPPQQQQQQQSNGMSGPNSGTNFVLLSGPPSSAAAAAISSAAPADAIGPYVQSLQQRDAGSNSATPTRDQLQRLGNDPDCFSYSYIDMCNTSKRIDIQQLLAHTSYKTALALVDAFNKDLKGPRVTFMTQPGDNRPGQLYDARNPGWKGIVMYWGKEWGVGYGSSKKLAKLHAAEEAVCNMYVSGIHFKQLPQYKGPRPTGGEAAAQGVQQQQQAKAGGSAAAAGVGGNLSAEEQLKRQYGERVKYKFMRNERSKMFMAAALHETADTSSRILVEEVGQGARADQAVDDAAKKLLMRLSGQQQQQYVEQYPAPPPRSQQQQPAPPPRLQQQQYADQYQAPLQQTLQQQQLGIPPWRSSNTQQGPPQSMVQVQGSGPPSGGFSAPPAGGQLGLIYQSSTRDVSAAGGQQGYLGGGQQQSAAQLAGGGQLGVLGGMQGFNSGQSNLGGYGMTAASYQPGGVMQVSGSAAQGYVPQQQQQQQFAYVMDGLGGGLMQQQQPQQQHGGMQLQGGMQGRMQGR